MDLRHSSLVLSGPAVVPAAVVFLEVEGLAVAPGMAMDLAHSLLGSSMALGDRLDGGIAFRSPGTAQPQATWHWHGACEFLFMTSFFPN